MAPAPKLTNKQKGTIIGAIVMVASILLGASEVNWGPSFSDDKEQRIQSLERWKAAESTKIDMIHEDTKHMRQRLDNFIDSH